MKVSEKVKKLKKENKQLQIENEYVDYDSRVETVEHESSVEQLKRAWRLGLVAPNTVVKSHALIDALLDELEEIEQCIT